jgi:hypothetical protein
MCTPTAWCCNGPLTRPALRWGGWGGGELGPWTTAAGPAAARADRLCIGRMSWGGRFPEWKDERAARVAMSWSDHLCALLLWAVLSPSPVDSRAGASPCPEEPAWLPVGGETGGSGSPCPRECARATTPLPCCTVYVQYRTSTVPSPSRAGPSSFPPHPTDLRCHAVVACTAASRRAGGGDHAAMETDHSLEPCGSGSKPSLRSRCTINRSFSFSSSESWRRLSWWPTYAPTTISPACSQGLQGGRRSRRFVRAKAHHRAPPRQPPQAGKWP